MSWISARAYAERKPLRLGLDLKFGELPDGWTKSRRSRAILTLTGLFGLILVAPFALLFAAAALRFIGLGQPFDWIASSPIAITAATVSLVIGLPVAFVVNVWPITRLGLRHETGEFEGLLALEFAPLHMFVVLVALIAGGLFVGHLAADANACMHGVHSAC